MCGDSTPPQNGAFCPQISPLLGSFDLQFLIAKEARNLAQDLPAVEWMAFRLIEFMDGIIFAPNNGSGRACRSITQQGEKPPFVEASAAPGILGMRSMTLLSFLFRS